MEMNQRICNKICEERLFILSERIDFLEEIKLMLNSSKYLGMGKKQLIELHKKNNIRELVEMMNSDINNPAKGITDWVNLKYKDAEDDFEKKLEEFKREYEEVTLHGISEEYYREVSDFYIDEDLGDDYDW